MSQRYRVRLPRSTPVPGFSIVVLGILTDTRLRLEFDGTLDDATARTMMALAVTGGRTSFTKGRDLGIEAACGCHRSKEPPHGS